MNERIRAALVPVLVTVGLGVLIGLGWTHHAGGRPAVSGEEAPAFSAPMLQRGDTLALSQLRGKVVLLNIWATWCAPCRFEMPSLERLYRELGPKGLEVMAVAVDDPPMPMGGIESVRPLVRSFVEKNGLTFPILLDYSGGPEQLFGATGLPTTIIIDRQGRVRGKVIGGREWDRAPLSDRVRALVEE